MHHWPADLYAHYLTFISPKTFDIFFSVELVTMVICGRNGEHLGGVVRDCLLDTSPNVLHVFDEYKDIFYGLILVLILIFVPEGFVVAVSKRWMSMTKSTRAQGWEES